MDRVQILSSMFNRDGFGLEIGPSYNPFVPKSSGAKIDSVDYTDQSGLINRYRNEPNVDLSRIEPVDYISDGRPLSEIIPRRKHYSYIIASHVIEHVPNLLEFLRDCSLLLTDDGVIALAVPDRRYCFDLFRPATSTGAILQAFYERRTRHPVGTLFDELAYASRCGGQITWAEQNTEPLTFVHTLEQAADKFACYNPGGPYSDCHAWQFTPSSFRLIMKDLADINLLDLKEHAFHSTIACEFFIALSRSAPGCSLDRITLASMAVAEATPPRFYPQASDVRKSRNDHALSRSAKAPQAEVRPPLRKIKKKLKRLSKSFQG